MYFIAPWLIAYNNKYGKNVLVLIFTEKIVTADSGVVLEQRFIACILASAFLCALPPPPADSQVRSINFVGFFACFHRYVSCLWNRRLNWLNDRTLPFTLSSAEAPAGYPYKNSNNRKNRKRSGDDGKREKVCSLFLSPQPPHNTTRPLGRRELPSRESRVPIKPEKPRQQTLLFCIDSSIQCGLWVNYLTHLAVTFVHQMLVKKQVTSLGMHLIFLLYFIL